MRSCVRARVCVMLHIDYKLATVLAGRHVSCVSSVVVSLLSSFNVFICHGFVDTIKCLIRPFFVASLLLQHCDNSVWTLFYREFKKVNRVFNIL